MKIDIQQIADTLLGDSLDQQFLEEINNMRDEITDDAPYGTVIGQSLWILKQHSERFVVQLLQRVVDEMNAVNGD